jgi:hypothetical protein
VYVKMGGCLEEYPLDTYGYCHITGVETQEAEGAAPLSVIPNKLKNIACRAER